MRKKIVVSVLVFLVLALLVTYTNKDFEKTAPSLYVNGNIITMNEKMPTAEAMLVIDGKIIAIGSQAELQNNIDKNLSVIDLKGASVLPGFIDPHTHFSISMFLSEMHDLSGFRFETNKEVWQEFERLVKTSNKGEWIICKGLDPILTHNLVPPTITYLDQVAPNNPVLFFSQSLHNYWANTKAFELVGIHKDTKDPSEESYYGKDEAGNLNGSIIEQEAIKPFFDILKSEVLTADLLSKAGSKVMTDYAKNGNTTIVSAGITIQDSKPLMLFEHLSNENPTLIGTVLEKFGLLPKRKQNPRHFMYMRHDMAHLMPEKNTEQNDFYKIIGVKHWYDGSPYVGSMYIEEPYLNSEFAQKTLHIPKGSNGKALIQPVDLKDFIKKNHENGWQLAFHAQGDAAINEVINAFDQLKTELDYGNSRHRLEHCLLFPHENIDKVKELHITPSFHVNHLYYYGDALKSQLLGNERTEKMLPIGSIQKSNIKYSLHADQPMFESNPFRLIQTAVERKTKSGDTIGLNERINVKEALKSLTTHAAWQIHMEDKIGSLEKGKYADFIVLDKNPLATKPSDIGSIKCLRTYINGNLVH